jgi:hypothetical protein
MTRRCASAWCHAEAEPGRDVCSWCHEHRGCFRDGYPRDPRHPWYRGRPGTRPPDPLRPYFANLMPQPQSQPRTVRVFKVPPR